VIIGLSSWVYSEYLNNPYFQSYMNSLSPILVPILSAGFGIASATVATVLYFTMRNIRQQEDVRKEDMASRRGSAKKTIKKPQASSSRSERTVIGGLSVAPRTRSMSLGESNPKRGTAQDSRDAEDESE
jgi:hypothetical protein